MSILDLGIVFLLLLIIALGGVVGIIRTLSFGTSIAIGSVCAHLLTPALFSVLKPFFAANELYGQITSFIAIFSLVAVLVQLLIKALFRKALEEQSTLERIGGASVAALLGIMAIGFCSFLVAAFASTCKTSAQGCPQLLLQLHEQRANSLLIPFFEALIKLLLSPLL